MNTKINAKDFFLQIAVIASLYTGIVALLNLLFRVINVAFPQVNNYYYSPSISLPVATLIVVFPLFLVLSNILRNGYKEDPSKKEYPVRKWLIYVTIFISIAILAGTLITLIYFFIDGRELTSGFLLKVLSVLVVIGGVFGYYMDDLKNRLSKGRRNLWRIGATVIVLGSIVAGFVVIGSPATQRAMRYDNQKVEDLQNIQWQIVNYWQQKGELPATLSELSDPLKGYSIPTNPKTDEPYEYTRTGNLSFELCAEFNKDSQRKGMEELSMRMPYDSRGMMNDNWVHSSGHHCFDRTIDPDLYPVRR